MGETILLAVSPLVSVVKGSHWFSAAKTAKIHLFKAIITGDVRGLWICKKSVYLAISSCSFTLVGIKGPLYVYPVACWKYFLTDCRGVLPCIQKMDGVSTMKR